MDIRERFNRATLQAARIEDLNRHHLKALLEAHDFAAITGLIQPDEITHAKHQLTQSFSVENDNSATGEDPKLLFDNYQKLSIGGGELREKDLAKCVRTFYNPVFADDIYGMREVFRRAAQVRNLVMDVALNFAIDSIEDGFWTAARIHHYPAGGGFMQGHVDDYIPMIYKGYDLNVYFQPLIVMSKRGTGEDCDYEFGGGYFQVGDEKVYYDEILELGTIILYNTKTFHGVTEVDPRKRFVQGGLSGRYSGLVTMYRDFTK